MSKESNEKKALLDRRGLLRAGAAAAFAAPIGVFGAQAMIVSPLQVRWKVSFHGLGNPRMHRLVVVLISMLIL